MGVSAGLRWRWGGGAARVGKLGAGVYVCVWGGRGAGASHLGGARSALVLRVVRPLLGALGGALGALRWGVLHLVGKAKSVWGLSNPCLRALRYPPTHPKRDLSEHAPGPNSTRTWPRAGRALYITATDVRRGVGLGRRRRIQGAGGSISFARRGHDTRHAAGGASSATTCTALRPRRRYTRADPPIYPPAPRSRRNASQASLSEAVCSARPTVGRCARAADS